MTTKIAAGLALLLALSGWGLYRQVAANGELQARMEQREAELRAERAVIHNLRLEIEERDEAVRLLEVRYEKLREKKAVVQTIVREVYVKPEVQEWARTAPPAPVIATINTGIDELWQSAAADSDSDGGGVPGAGDDG